MIRHENQGEREHVEISSNRSILFGPFELRLESRELFKHGIRLRLQGKPFEILRALLERPGAVVTRRELQTRLWPAAADVDAESCLNTAANRLRLALGDSPSSPRYIETLPRVGYRFIAPVSEGTAGMPVRQSGPVPVPYTDPSEKPADDLEAVRLVVEAVQNFEEEEQRRIFRWAAEKLGLKLACSEAG